MGAKVGIVSAEEIAEKGGSLLPEDYLGEIEEEKDPPMVSRETTSAGLTEEMKGVILKTIRRYLDIPAAEMQLRQERPAKRIEGESITDPVRFEPGEDITLTLTIKCKAKQFRKSDD